jgi:transcriptional regulator with XRE-family HTH domain
VSTVETDRGAIPSVNLRADIGKRLRLARETAGVTQLELAEAIGLTRTSIANIEAGRQGLLLEDAAAVARKLRVSLDSLAGRTGR